MARAVLPTALGLTLGLICTSCGSDRSVEAVLAQCPPVDLVFAMDTSGSMEDEAAALCTTISGVEQSLRDRGLDEIRTTLLGITETDTVTETGDTGTPDFSCLTNTVYRVAGGDGTHHPQVPGNAPPETTFERRPGEFRTVDGAELDPFADEAEEYWAAAAAILADDFDWRPDPAMGPPTVRLVVTISDESPQSGADDCFDVDDLAVDNAIDVAVDNGVIVSTIIGEGSDQDACVRKKGEDLARGTGGTSIFSRDAATDFPPALFDIVVDACRQRAK
ncbi:MAG: hypothetical protein KC543_08420 [Myxococcales bacterium]|nr:hypothetical protein [Myxococcales bacterium]